VVTKGLNGHPAVAASVQNLAARKSPTRGGAGVREARVGLSRVPIDLARRSEKRFHLCFVRNFQTRAVSFARTRTAGKASRIPQLMQWQRSRQPLGSQHSHPAGVRQEIGQIFDYNAVLFDHKGRRFVTGVPRGDRIPYLYHPTLPACGQVLSAPPQPAEFDRYKVFAETKPIEAKPPPPLPQPTPEPP